MVALVGAALATVVWPVPDAWFVDIETRQVVDRHGTVLVEQVVPGHGRGNWTGLDQVAPAVIDAVLAAEDDRFYDHVGLDARALARATVANLRAGGIVQGGSTISQQTARLLAGRSPGWTGKATEATRALRLEWHLDKDAILTWYLNRAYFGANAWGIEAAARETFDESAASLSLAEAATLVGALPAPSRLHPSQDPDAALAARDRVLDRLVTTGRRTQEEVDQAKREPLELRRPHRPWLAYHAGMKLLAAHPTHTRVRSTIDASMQRRAEELVARHLEKVGDRDIDHAAVVVVDVEDSSVLAWVGSGGLEAPGGYVDGASALRSPGSSLKPFLYGLAFEGGETPADILPDIPVAYPTSHGVWTPDNYSGRFHGPVRVREALACSFNVPAVALLDEVGVPTLVDRMHRIGIGPPERPAHYGLGLILGDAEVSLAALTNAYAGLARGGVYTPLRLTDLDPRVEGTRFLEEGAAWWVTDILSDPIARVPAFGRYGPLERPYRAAVKTGTSTAFRDNWTVGYTDRYAIGVWVGNFDGRSMRNVSGVTGAGPLWADLVDHVTDGEGARAQPPPEGLDRIGICTLSGEPAGPQCPHRVDEWLPEEHGSRPPCTWHPQDCVIAWPSEFTAWAAESEAAEGCTTRGAVSIASPGSGATLFIDPRLPLERQRVPLRANAPSGAREARWFVDGIPLGTVGRPFELLWQPGTSGRHVVEVVVDGRASEPVEVWVGGIEG